MNGTKYAEIALQPVLSATLQCRFFQRKRQSKGRSRKALPNSNILRIWLTSHMHNPYPTAEEKTSLVLGTGIDSQSLNYWFINARRRLFTKRPQRPRQKEDKPHRRGDPPASHNSMSCHGSTQLHPYALLTSLATLSSLMSPLPSLSQP